VKCTNDYVVIGLVVLAILLLIWFIAKSDKEKGRSSFFSKLDSDLPSLPDISDCGGGGGEGSCGGDGCD
jgi:hypothetical protein